MKIKCRHFQIKIFRVSNFLRSGNFLGFKILKRQKIFKGQKTFLGLKILGLLRKLLIGYLGVLFRDSPKLSFDPYFIVISEIV